MSSSAPSRPPRPDVVTAISIIYCFWALAFFYLLTEQLTEVMAGRDRTESVLEVSVAILALAVRSVGMIRLFLMRADAWLWLAVALIMSLPIAILSIFNRRVLGDDLTLPVLAAAVHYLIATGLIVYAFRLFQDSGKRA